MKLKIYNLINMFLMESLINWSQLIIKLDNKYIVNISDNYCTITKHRPSLFILLVMMVVEYPL